ncbi:molybdate ABC transporter substrate-binding protein [Rhodoferax sp.]|uniref:molybdate ABC transporter substrate-binding protein n=1 Tax=Rhodoferax sp. TaxID=50421 RepID=UPI00272320CA|nr:molybdate ABC transporter substrate-binding protein [Rhodoferax sp.]MDO9199155.1 molybdate ABC transporter substrate-binding protein [Rhodoferax sp.]
MYLTRSLGAVLVATLPLLVAAQQLTVSAAVSLTNVFNELAPKFEAGKPGVTLRFNFGPSGVLLQQVVQGAPVDVLASADQATVTRGIEQKLFDADTRRDFARNTVVLVVPAQGAADIKTLADLTSASVRRIAIGKPATMPAGRYAKEALDSARLWSTLEPKFVFADNVRQVLDYVARGEVDAGFVYRTDAALGAGKVKIVLTTEGHTPVSYPVVVVSESRNKALARDFISFLSTPPAQDALAKYGFGKP